MRSTELAEILPLPRQVEAAPLADDKMKLVLALLASAGAMELSADNFKTEVFESGKNAFVKFLAPW